MYSCLKPGFTYSDLLDGIKGITGGVVIRSQHLLDIKGQSVRKGLGESCVSIWVNWDKGVLEINSVSDDKHSVRIMLITTSRRVFDSLSAFFCANLADPHNKGRIYALFQASPQHGVSIKDFGLLQVPLERDNYTPDVLVGYDTMVNDLQSSDPAGRLAVITGSPGTGKTYLLRALVTQLNAIFLLVPSKFIPNLGDPSIINCLIDLRDSQPEPIVLLLEDADTILSRRSGTNMDGIMSALNLGDGLMGDMLDARLIATSNVVIDEVDPALTRPGRLSVQIDVGNLSAEHATRILRRLLPSSMYNFKSDAPLAQVYKKARELGYNHPSTRVVSSISQETPLTVPSIVKMNRSRTYQ